MSLPNPVLRINEQTSLGEPEECLTDTAAGEAPVSGSPYTGTLPTDFPGAVFPVGMRLRRLAWCVVEDSPESFSGGVFVETRASW